MAFEKLTASLDAVTSLADTPNRTSGLTASQMKQKFTDNAQTIKDYINDVLLPALEDTGATSGYSGAKNIGVANDAEFGGYTNIEDVLMYFRGLIRQAVAGEIGDNDIKTAHLDHTSGIEAVDTPVIRNGAVTNAKLAGGITSDKIASVLATTLIGYINMTNIADGSIPYTKLGDGIRATQLYGEIPVSKLASDFTLPIAKGGTGATTAAQARENLCAAEMKIQNNITVATSAWASDSTYTDYPYRAFVAVNGITADWYANVCISEASKADYDFCGSNDTASGGVYIYCADLPTTAITISTICAWY